MLHLLTAGPQAGRPHLDQAQAAAEQAAAGSDPVLDEDFQLTLTVLYELHYRGLEGVSDDWEWHPGLLGLRAVLERRFERAVRERVTRMLAESGHGEWNLTDQQARPQPSGEQVAETLLALTAPSSGPSLSGFLAKRANLGQYQELLITRSIYHLKEADPHSFAIPRLNGAAKVALVEVQADEYGGGRPDWIHSGLFARTMTELGLESRYGHYLDQVPAAILAGTNAMSLFGLHRRLRAAVAGHLAVFEMTSTRPNRLYGNGLRRLGYGPSVTRYFDEHVEADAVHEQIALRDLIGGLLRQEPELAADVLLGAGTAVVLDDVASGHLLENWNAGRTALRSNGLVVAA